MNEAKRQIEPNNTIFILVGTKTDKEQQREVPTEQAQQFADYHNLLFVETSSKQGINVEKAFRDLAIRIYDQLEEGALNKIKLLKTKIKHFYICR